MLSVELIDSLFPADLPEPSHWAERYPARELPAGAQVTRFAPSPTGWLHIGGIFTASVNLDLARHTGGVYLLRIEDTDQARFEEGALAQFEAGFEYFGIAADESDMAGGAYGPLYQVDPQSGTVIVFMMQTMPNTTDIQPKFMTAVYQALVN